MKAAEVTGGRPVTVIGAGLVGAGWAIVFARAGLNVRMFDVNPQVLESAPALVAQQLDGLHSYGLLTESVDTIRALWSEPEDVAAHSGVASGQPAVSGAHR